MSGDIGFRAPRGVSEAEVRRSFERLDGRVKRAFFTQTQLENQFAEVKEGFAELQEKLDTGLSELEDELKEEFNATASDIILAAFTSDDQEVAGFYSIQTAASLDDDDSYIVSVHETLGPRRTPFGNIKELIVSPQHMGFMSGAQDGVPLNWIVMADSSRAAEYETTLDNINVLFNNALIVWNKVQELIGKLKDAKVLT